MEPGASVTARALTKVYERGLVRALDNASLEIDGGEQVVVMGPTGSGKSTLLSILALLEKPDSGELLLDGVAGSRLEPAERWRAENLGIAFQFHHLLPYMSAEENVELALLGRQRRSRRTRARAHQLVKDIGLEHRATTRAANLSGGERQLVAVARALAHRPRLVLADEPTGNVDVKTGDKILDVLFDWSASTGATLVIVTHNPLICDRATRLVRLCDGRVVES